jgi:hypothetical protein
MSWFLILGLRSRLVRFVRIRFLLTASNCGDVITFIIVTALRLGLVPVYVAQFVGVTFERVRKQEHLLTP